MFKQFQNIETSVKHIRLFSILLLITTILLNFYAVYKSHDTIKRTKNVVYVIANGKLLEANAADRSETLPIEIRDHVKTFHDLFYNLEPDDEINTRRITKALDLADENIKKEYYNLKEQGYYTALIAGNVSQRVEEPDSIVVNTTTEPYQFRYYGQLKIIRASTIATRRLITEGIIRTTRIGNNNPHGFLIERWRVLDNTDISIEKR